MSEAVEITRAIEANGVESAQLGLFCPGCGIAHFVNVKPWRDGCPVWTWNGDRSKPTFAPSLLVGWNGVKGDDDNPRHPYATSERRVCHSFVREGQWQFLGDCTHALRGQTVAIPPFRFYDDEDEA
jgi:hypothetical protein